MPDLDRLRTAARDWLEFVGDIDDSPVIGDTEGAEAKARYRLGQVLRDELFQPERRGPLFVWSSEMPLRGRQQHWGGSDVWRCDEHPDWQGDELGGWESYRDFVARNKPQKGRVEADVRRHWEEKSIEAHAALHGVVIDFG